MQQGVTPASLYLNDAEDKFNIKVLVNHSKTEGKNLESQDKKHRFPKTLFFAFSVFSVRAI